MASVNARIDLARLANMYDSDDNNHSIMATNRDVAVHEALGILQDISSGNPNGAEVLLVAGSTSVYNQALGMGFAAHVVRPIIEETDGQRAARLVASGAPHCNCRLEQLVPGAGACTHHTLVNPTVLLCDCIPYVDPAVLRGVVSHYGTGRVVAIQMWEGGGIGACDPTGSRECVQIYDSDTLTAYVAGNNGPYVQPRLSVMYPPGNRSGISFSFKVRCGLVQVISLGLCSYSPNGYMSEAVSGMFKYDIVYHGPDGFLLVSRKAIAEILYVLQCPPSLHVDHASRNELVARQKAAALCSRAFAAPMTGLGLTTDFTSGVVSTFGLEDCIGRLVLHILCAHRASFATSTRLRIFVERLRTKAGVLGVNPGGTLLLSGLAVAGLEYSTRASIRLMHEVMETPVNAAWRTGGFVVRCSREGLALSAARLNLWVRTIAQTEPWFHTPSWFSAWQGLRGASTVGLVSLAGAGFQLPLMIPMPIIPRLLFRDAIDVGLCLPNVPLMAPVPDLAYAKYAQLITQRFNEGVQAVDPQEPVWRYATDGWSHIFKEFGGFVSYPHPMLYGPENRLAFAVQMVWRNAIVLMSPVYEEWIPEIGLAVSLFHIWAAPDHNLHPLLTLEWYTRVLMTLSDIYTRDNRFRRWRIGLHMCRNVFALGSMVLLGLSLLDNKVVNMAYIPAIPEGLLVELGFADLVESMRQALGCFDACLGFIGPLNPADLWMENYQPPPSALSAAFGYAFGTWAGRLLVAGSLWVGVPWALGRLSKWHRRSVRVHERKPADEKTSSWFWSWFGYSEPSQPATVQELHRRLIEDNLTEGVSDAYVASSPGSFAPEWSGDLNLSTRRGWTVSVNEPFNGLVRRDSAVAPARLGLTVLTYANGMTPRNAIAQDLHDFVQMAEGRILNINQREDPSMKLDFARRYLETHLSAMRLAAGVEMYKVPELGTVEFDSLAADFISHFPVKRIAEKWRGILAEWRELEFDTRYTSIPKYSVFLKLESWWKLAAKGSGLHGQYVAHKPRAIWVPDERRVLVSSIAIYGIAKDFKQYTHSVSADRHTCLLYTSSMTGDQVGEAVHRFRRSSFDSEDTSTWFLLLVNGDDNWMCLHPELTARHPKIFESFAGWASHMREVGRNTEPVCGSFFASSFCSSSFKPALTADGAETYVLTPCWARVACKLGTTLAAIPQSRLHTGGVPSLAGYHMWLRRMVATTRDFARVFSHDPIGSELFRRIGAHCITLLGDKLVGPVLARGERELMAEEYQMLTEGVLQPHPELYKVATEQWFGKSFSEIEEGARQILAAWESITFDGDVLLTGSVGQLGCDLFLRGLGNQGPGVPCFKPESFIDPRAGEKAQGGLCDIPEQAHLPGGYLGPDPDVFLTHEHLAKCLASFPGIVILPAQYGNQSRYSTAFLRVMVLHKQSVRVFIPGRRAGRLVNIDGVKKGTIVPRTDLFDSDTRILVFLAKDETPEAFEEEYPTIHPTFITFGDCDRAICGPAPFLIERPGRRVEWFDGEYCLLGGEATVVVAGCEREHPQSAPQYCREGHMLMLAYSHACGLTQLVSQETKWAMPLEGIITVRDRTTWDFPCFESDAAAFDNSTTEESITELVALLRNSAQWQGRAEWLLESLKCGAAFRTKGHRMTGTTKWCWPSGIPLTSLGGSLMNAMEFIECMRRCFTAAGVEFRLPSATMERPAAPEPARPDGDVGNAGEDGEVDLFA